MNIYSHNNTFNHTKYTKWYYSIIEIAFLKKEIRLKDKKSKNHYYEMHHILPKCMFPNYVKESWNLVLLTAREHFIVHILLTKMTEGKNKRDMVTSVITFNNRRPRREKYINSRLFDIARKLNRKCGKENPRYGKPHTKECIERIKVTRALRNITSKGSYWVNNGIVERMIKDLFPPEGWKLGRLNCIFSNFEKQKEFSKRGLVARRKNRKVKLKSNFLVKGSIWINNGEEERRSNSIPLGFKRGRLIRIKEYISLSPTFIPPAPTSSPE